MANLPRITDDSFDAEVLQSPVPVLVDFSAEWCGPCKALAPTLVALAKEYEGKAKFVTVDIDDARRTAMRFNITSVPTIMVFRRGEVVSQALGNQPRNKVADLLNTALGA